MISQTCRWCHSLYCGLLNLMVWTLIDRLYRDIAGFMYLLDVLVVAVHISHRNCWEYLLLHQDWGECSAEGWAGAWGWGVGGGWKFLVTEIFFSSQKTSSWGSKTHTNFFFSEGGGGVWGVWGAPRPHPGVARGRKMIHFFLWPWHVTG